MNLKKLATLFKSKGVDLSAEEIAEFADEERTVANVPAAPLPKPAPVPSADYSREIAELQNSFEKKLTERDAVIESLKQQISDYAAASLKKEEERAAKEKAFEEEQQKQIAAKLETDRKAIINDAVKAGKIAPKDDKIIKRLETLDLDSVKDIIEALPPAPSSKASNDPDGKTQSTKNTRYDAPLSPRESIDGYLEDLKIN